MEDASNGRVDTVVLDGMALANELRADMAEEIEKLVAAGTLEVPQEE